MVDVVQDDIMALAPQGLSELVPALSVGPFVATTNGLTIIGTPTFDECYTYARGLRVVHQALIWYIGDLLNYVEAAYGETYAAITALFPEYSLDYLRHIKMVSNAFPPSRRRAEELSLSHHREVVSLPPEEQDRWLKRAVEEELGRDALRQAIREQKNPRNAFFDDLFRLREMASGLMYRAPTEPDRGTLLQIVIMLDRALTEAS